MRTPLAEESQPVKEEPIVSSATRIAVMGLYNSGSTALAGMLYRLGVNMGPPFWQVCDDGAANNYYEPYELSWQLRQWWDEPRGIARVPASDRVRFLRCWAALQECMRPGPWGAKHPLLSLCGDDIQIGWGPRTRFIWSWRPLDESIRALHRRGWFGNDAEPLQERLWKALTDFDRRRRGVIRLDWTRVKSEPQWAARELASLVGIAPTETELQAAAEFIRVAAEPCGGKKKQRWMAFAERA